MHCLTAKNCCLSILLLCVLELLLGCAPVPSIVYKDRLIEVPVPGKVEIDQRLLADCDPVTSVPMSGSLPLEDVIERLSAVELALDLCRNDKAELRKSLSDSGSAPES